MKYRRSKSFGSTFFFTLVTYEREKIFANEENINLLRNVIRNVKITHPFMIDAFVLLPDHMHFMWTLFPEDNDFSTKIRLIKSNFTRLCNPSYKKINTSSRIYKKEQMIWQRRFWEHEIQSDNDLEEHFNYIHYNPVKHGYVNQVCDWPYSSFFKYLKQGFYNKNWGGNYKNNTKLKNE